MESAALILLALELGLASSMSVLFGWQPMPDGSAKVEYIVQLEPELVATLRAGQSIPITSDIPDDIGPIGRIRIVVGRDELPQQKLATQFKPWPQQTVPEKQPRAGLVETQYTVPPVETTGSGRYGDLAAANNKILPPSAATAANPFGRALQQGAKQARNLAAEAEQQILPPADQLFGTRGGNSQAVRNAIGNTTNQMRQGFQQGVERVADQTGQQLRQAVDNMGQQAQGAIDKFGRSTSPERSVLTNSNGDNGQNQRSATILPPDSSPRDQAGNGQFATKGQRIDRPIQEQQPGSWPTPPTNLATEPSPRRTNPGSQPSRFDAPWPTATSNPASGRYGGDRAIEPPAAAPTWPSDQNGRDVFDVANRDSDISPPGLADARQPGYNPTPSGVDGPQLTQPTQQSSQQQRSPQQQQVSQQLASEQSGGAQWPANPTTPEVRGYMLEKPVNSDQQTAGSISSPGQQGYQPPSTQSPPPFTTGNYSAGSNGAGDNGTGPSNNKALFPLLLSWVLLSGSGAGNLYLFWSYLDVRSKYQGVVHGSSRRRQQYDD